MHAEPTPNENFTGDANYPAGQRDTRIASDQVDPGNKAFVTLRAQFALRGHALYRTSTVDGAVTYYAERWGQVRHLPTLDDAKRFLVQIGGAA